MKPPSITSVVLSAPTSGGFAIAQVRYALGPLVTTVTTVPTVGTAAFTGLAMLLLAGGALLARRKQLEA